MTAKTTEVACENESMLTGAKSEENDVKTDEKNIDIAVVYLKDALAFRDIQRNIGNMAVDKTIKLCQNRKLTIKCTRIELYRFVHSWEWKKFIIILVWLNMIRSFWEEYSIMPLV